MLPKQRQGSLEGWYQPFLYGCNMNCQIIWSQNFCYTLHRNLNLSFFIYEMRFDDDLWTILIHINLSAFDSPQASRLFLSLVLLSPASCLPAFHCLLILSSEAFRKLKGEETCTLRVLRRLTVVLQKAGGLLQSSW